MTTDTARRERAEKYAKWHFNEVNDTLGKLRSCDLNAAYLAGALDETAEKDAEIAALKQNDANREALLDSLLRLRNEHILEIAALREAVRHLHWVADKPAVYPMRFCEAVRRALGETP